MSACRACKAKIRWVEAEGGSAMPLDWDPSPDGNVELVGETEDFQVARVYSPTSVKPAGATLYKSHFATCPEAARFRKRR